MAVSNNLQFGTKALRQSFHQSDVALQVYFLSLIVNEAPGWLPAREVLDYAALAKKNLDALITESKETERVGMLYDQIGIVYYKQRDWPNALENYRLAIEWEEKTQQYDQLGGTYHQIGMLYHAQRDWPNALENYRRAIESYEKTQQYDQLGGTYHQIGMVYEKQLDWPKAAQMYIQSHNLYTSYDPQSPDISIVLNSAVRLLNKMIEFRVEIPEELKRITAKLRRGKNIKRKPA